MVEKLFEINIWSLREVMNGLIYVLIERQKIDIIQMVNMEPLFTALA